MPPLPFEISLQKCENCLVINIGQASKFSVLVITNHELAMRCQHDTVTFTTIFNSQSLVLFRYFKTKTTLHNRIHVVTDHQGLLKYS